VAHAGSFTANSSLLQGTQTGRFFRPSLDLCACSLAIPSSPSLPPFLAFSASFPYLSFYPASLARRPPAAAVPYHAYPPVHMTSYSRGMLLGAWPDGHDALCIARRFLRVRNAHHGPFSLVNLQILNRSRVRG
jgi:hypothetical protein